MGSGQSAEQTKIDEICQHLDREKVWLIQEGRVGYGETEILKNLDGVEEYYDKKYPRRILFNTRTACDEINRVDLKKGRLYFNRIGGDKLIAKLENKILNLSNEHLNFDLNVDLQISNFEKTFGYYNAFYYFENNSVIMLIVYKNVTKIIIIKNLSGFGETSEYKIKQFELTAEVFCFLCRGAKFYIATFDKNLYKIDMKESLDSFNILFSNLVIKQEFGDDIIYQGNLKVRFDFENDQIYMN